MQPCRHSEQQFLRRSHLLSSSIERQRHRSPLARFCCHPNGKPCLSAQTTKQNRRSSKQGLAKRRISRYQPSQSETETKFCGVRENETKFRVESAQAT